MKKNVLKINGWVALIIILAAIAWAGFTSYGALFPGNSTQASSTNIFDDISHGQVAEPNYLKGAMLALIVLIGFFAMGGLRVLNPGEGLIARFAGVYKGELQDNGFWLINPLYSTEKITLKLQNHEIKPIKVNDKDGNPVEIGAVIVYSVSDMYKAKFEVENYNEYNATQSEAALRRVTGKYEYNVGGENDSEGLSSSNDLVRQELIKEISSHVIQAGISISDANITHLTYAPEIASAMLQKQQAKATVAARKTIVEGAIGIVEEAIKSLENKKIGEFNGQEKARLASNLLVVICGEKSPVTTVSLS